MNQLKKIIPCLDIDEGRVVKGVNFVDIKDIGDPAELALRYNNDGADELGFMDIGAASKSRSLLLGVVSKVAARISIPLCVGGGISSIDDARNAMNAGANKVSVCSAPLKRPQLLSEIAQNCGSSCLALSIDSKRVDGTEGNLKWHAFSHGGTIDSGLDVIEWAIRAEELGVGEIILNSIDGDGTMAGYDLELIRRVKNAVKIPIIASGGAGSLEQIAGVLTATDDFPGADGALVASLLHFGKTTVREIKEFAKAKGVCFIK